MTRFTEIGRTNASEAVRTQLLKLIESGRIGVGERLPSEHELARSFGVSRPVIREALGTLRALGLVVSRSGSGTFVKSRRPESSGLSLLGRYSTDELHEVRSHLEIPGAGLAATRRTPEQLARLRAIVDSQQSCTEPGAWVELDAAFHVALAEATGNQVQARLVESLRALLVEQSLAVAKIEGRLVEANDEHGSILEAVIAGDGGGARRAMTRHLRKIRIESHRLCP